MRRSQRRRRGFSSGSDEEDAEDSSRAARRRFSSGSSEEDAEDLSSAARRRRRRRTRMKCLSCKEEYGDRDAGTCRGCYEEAGDTKEELKHENDELKSKIDFLRLLCFGPDFVATTNTPCFSDVVLVASGPPDSANSQCSPPSIPAHWAVLTSRSPVFRAMLENEMESHSVTTITISDVSYDALRAFVNYLYTAEACLDDHMACDLLVLAEKYQVQHLKTYCENYLMSKLNWENSLPYYVFFRHHGAKSLLDAALSLIMDNMEKLSKREEYMELVEKDPRLVIEIYEAYVSKQVNTSTSKDPLFKA
ncbi:hypothetical protein DH2020_034773 [Rehmannia glutinosa]|uniref:BTB domain-containing protein n=1 Tax=Rehmannia glutinosa TaxID=99300 RepID=A0ABR0VBS4_REHGL